MTETEQESIAEDLDWDLAVKTYFAEEVQNVIKDTAKEDGTNNTEQ